MTRTIKLLTVASAMALLAACGGGGEEAQEKKIEDTAKRHGIDADVELDDKGEVKSVTINNGMGSTVGNNLDLPDGFPSDVPMVDGWSIMSTSQVPGQQGGFMIQAMTSDDANTTIAKVRKAMTAEGWSEENAGGAGGQLRSISFSKGDRMTNVNLIPNGAQLAVQMITMKKPG